MHKKRLVGSIAMFAAAAMVLAGCGGSSGGSQGSSTAGTSSSAGASALQAQAKEKVAGYESFSKTYPGPTTPVNPGTGKAEVLSCGAGACVEQSGVAVTALRKLGWSVPPYADGQFSPAVESAFMNRAVQHGDDAVILVAVDVNTIKASVEAAASAGMIIMCTQCQSGPQWAGKVYDVTVNFHDQGEIEAWKVIADKGDKAKVFGTQDPQFSQSVAKGQGLKDGITADCPTCKVEISTFPSGTAAQAGPPQFTAFLASHPVGTVDYYVPHFDGLSVPVVKTTQNAGRTDFLIGGTDGSEAGINTLAKNNPPMAFDVVEPFTYEEWCAADLIARIKTKAAVWTGYDAMPSTLIDSSNITQFIAQYPDESPTPDGYQANFLKLWGKS